MERLAIAADGSMQPGDSLALRALSRRLPGFPLTNVWTDTVSAGFSRPKVYVVQTNTKVIERCLLMTTDPGDLVLDPTCGSGTTAYVAEQWGRRWITIDTSRVALALARTRLMAAQVSRTTCSPTRPRASRKEAELTGRRRQPTPTTPATSARASSTSACRTSR